ncbi:hypothetical protein [Spirosoma koreense]
MNDETPFFEINAKKQPIKSSNSFRIIGTEEQLIGTVNHRLSMTIWQNPA